MKLKTFRAPNMPGALAEVKRSLGVDAVIVQTRSFKKGGFFGLGARTVVEVTARPGEVRTHTPKPRSVQNRLQRLYAAGQDAASRPQRDPSPGLDRYSALNSTPPIPSAHINVAPVPSLASPPPAGPQDQQLRDEISCLRKLVEGLVKEQRFLHEPQMPEQLFDIYLDLIQREVADEIARELIESIQREITGDQAQSADIVRRRLVGEMDRMIKTTGPIGLGLSNQARVVALIGPTGVGKTTTIAKIAANLKLRQNKKVGLITIDTYRIGAVDQLRMYAQIINVPVKVVLTPAELKEAVETMRDLDVVLIDTAGRSQNDELKIQELKTFLDAARPDEIHLVLSSTTHHANMINAAEKFKTIGVDRIILTKLDEAVSFGVVLSVLKKVDASISYITTGQDVPDDIEVGNGRRLAQMLLGMEGIKTFPSSAIA